jgi:hypothetical protein
MEEKIIADIKIISVKFDDIFIIVPLII